MKDFKNHFFLLLGLVLDDFYHKIQCAIFFVITIKFRQCVFKLANENLGADFVHDKVFLLGYITLNYNTSYFESFCNTERKELKYLLQVY